MAKKLQRFWRNMTPTTVLRLVRAVEHRGVTFERLRALTFDQLVTLLREAGVVNDFKSLLHRIHYGSCLLSPTTQINLMDRTVNARVVLAAYMMTVHPAQTFENQHGQLETALIANATQLMDTFERVSELIKTDPRGSFQAVPPTVAHDFLTALSAYMPSFNAWKVPDAARLKRRVEHALNALYNARHNMYPTEPVGSPLITEFDTQIHRLEGKLQQLSSVVEVAEFRARIMNELGTPTAAPPAGPVLDTASAMISRSITNEHLAHQLLLDPEFRLQDDGGMYPNDPTGTVHRAFSESFWVGLADDLVPPLPAHGRVFRVLREMRDAVVDLMGDHDAGVVRGLLDVDTISQQIGAGAWTWGESVNLLVNVSAVIRRNQTFLRNGNFDVVWTPLVVQLNGNLDPTEQPQLLCRALEFLFQQVSFMRIDAANVRLILISPVINAQGIDYERGKFEARLNAGTTTLANTSAWIRDTVLVASQALAPVVQELMHGEPQTTRKIFADAQMRLLTSTQYDTVWPETLVFDAREFGILRLEIEHIIRIGRVLTEIRNVIADEHYAPEDVEVALGLLLALPVISDDTAVVTRLVQEARLVVSRLNHDVSDVVLQTIGGNVHRSLLNPMEPVTVLLRRRLHAAFHSAANGADVATLVVQGMEPLLPRIRVHATRFARIGEVNRGVHGVTYARLLREAAVALGGV